MKIEYGDGKTSYGPGVLIALTGEEVARAIKATLVAQGVYIQGPSTIRVNGEMCREGQIYVDPCGSVLVDGEEWSGRGPEEDPSED